MNKIQEATLLLKKFGYRILRESTEGLDESNIEDTVSADKAIKDLLNTEGLGDEKAVVAPKSTDITIYVEVGERQYLICKDSDVARDTAIEDNKDFLENDPGLRYCGINLKNFGRTWKEFINTEDYDLDLDDIEADPAYEGIDWEDATSVADYFDDNYIDWQKVSEFCVDEDGPANTLARYDGKEIELEDGYLAYRIE